MMRWYDVCPPSNGEGWVGKEQRKKARGLLSHRKFEVLIQHSRGDNKQTVGYASLEFMGIAEGWRSEFGSHLHI